MVTFYCQKFLNLEISGLYVIFFGKIILFFSFLSIFSTWWTNTEISDPLNEISSKWTNLFNFLCISANLGVIQNSRASIMLITSLDILHTKNNLINFRLNFSAIHKFRYKKPQFVNSFTRDTFACLNILTCQHNMSCNKNFITLPNCTCKYERLKNKI